MKKIIPQNIWVYVIACNGGVMDKIENSRKKRLGVGCRNHGHIVRNARYSVSDSELDSAEGGAAGNGPSQEYHQRPL